MCQKPVLIASIFGGGVILIALGAGFGWGLFPNVVEEEIGKAVALVEGSEAWDAWVELPIVLQMKVYFFEVTNVEDIYNNQATPAVVERGPYVYDLYKSKYDIILHDQGREASYYQKQRLYYNQMLSGDLLETDEITMLNAVIMGASLIGDMEYQDSSIPGDDRLLSVMAEALPNVFPDATSVFTKYSVKQMLFDGVPIKCAGSRGSWRAFCAAIEALSQESLTFRPDPDSPGDYLFALFYSKNVTHDGRYRVNTGVDDPRQLGNVVQWQNSTTLPWWSAESCNVIKGTDAAIFPPFLTREDKVDIFSTDLCRSVYAVYQRDIEYKGIKGYRYVADDRQLGTAQQYPENYCWCSEKSGCMRAGTLDVYSCLGAPMILSFPHFYQASPDFINGVTGLNPNKDDHELFLEMEPNSGVPLRGAKRIQFNMMIKPIRNIPFTDNLPYALVPLFWADEGVELDDANTELLRTELIDVLVALDATRWTLLSVGLALVVAAVVIFFVYLPTFRKQKVQKD